MITETFFTEPYCPFRELKKDMRSLLSHHGLFNEGLCFSPKSPDIRACFGALDAIAAEISIMISDRVE